MSSSTFECSTPACNSHLLLLPYELRRNIWHRVLHSDKLVTINDEHARGIYRPRFSAIRLLRTCKQIHAETAPIVYRKMEVYGGFDHWVGFFHKIGTRNLSLVRDLSLHYGCNRNTPSHICLGSCCDFFGSWSILFKELMEAKPGLRSLTLPLFPCDCAWACLSAMQHVYFASEVFQDESSPFHPLQISSLVNKEIKFPINNDLLIFKSIVNLCRRSNVAKIVMTGDFNPLWGHFLHKKLGFISKRSSSGDTNTWTLADPDGLYTLDLKGYALSRRHKDIYDKVKEESEESGTKNPDTHF
ncbi:hypothetical protein AAE478_001239 [Parahypoxylon ruwenzoriense]